MIMSTLLSTYQDVHWIFHGQQDELEECEIDCIRNLQYFSEEENLCDFDEFLELGVEPFAFIDDYEVIFAVKKQDFSGQNLLIEIIILHSEDSSLNDTKTNFETIVNKQCVPTKSARKV